MQLGFGFDLMNVGNIFAPTPAAAAELSVDAGNSDDLEIRRAFVLQSAARFQGHHDRSGLQYSVDGHYAAELLRVADDLLADPEYYRARPSTGSSDVRWFRAKGVRHE